MSDAQSKVVCEVEVPNEQGLHARPVMVFVDVAAGYESTITVKNLTRDGEEVDGKSAMHMMLLEATRGCVLRITAEGPDANEASVALAALVKAGFKLKPNPRSE